MRFLLDTNICSEYLRRAGKLFHRFGQHAGQLAISAVTFSELTAWAYKQHDPSVIASRVEQFVELAPVLPFDFAVAQIAGRVRGEQLRQGISFNPSDLMIAATALAHDLTW